MGIEPTSKAWEAFILPMNYARSFVLVNGNIICAVVQEHKEGFCVAKGRFRKCIHDR